MPRVQPPTYFKTDDENNNRRQDSEDRFFSELLGAPREFLADGVVITVEVASPSISKRLDHGLGYPAQGWLLRRVERPAPLTSGPTLPFYRSDLVSDNNTLELFFENVGTYTFLVF